MNPATAPAAAAGSAFRFSDRRLKRDIRPIGKLPNGLNVYRFRYQWADEETTGVMADEANGFLACSHRKGFELPEVG